jgi:hypothetical protein
MHVREGHPPPATSTRLQVGATENTLSNLAAKMLASNIQLTIMVVSMSPKFTNY